jgi:hypothetical protein
VRSATRCNNHALGEPLYYLEKASYHASASAPCANLTSQVHVFIGPLQPHIACRKERTILHVGTSRDLPTCQNPRVGERRRCARPHLSTRQHEQTRSSGKEKIVNMSRTIHAPRTSTVSYLSVLASCQAFQPCSRECLVHGFTCATTTATTSLTKLPSRHDPDHWVTPGNTLSRKIMYPYVRA